MFLVMGIRYNYSSYLVVYLSLYNGVNVTRAVISRYPGTIRVQARVARSMVSANQR